MSICICIYCCENATVEVTHKRFLHVYIVCVYAMRPYAYTILQMREKEFLEDSGQQSQVQVQSCGKQQGHHRKHERTNLFVCRLAAHSSRPRVFSTSAPILNSNRARTAVS